MNTAHTSLQDSIKIANELGRLDFISSLLAIVAIMVGLFAIFGFAYIRNTAQSQAKNIAQQISREVSERIANEYMQDKMPLPPISLYKSIERVVFDEGNSIFEGSVTPF